MDNQESIVIYQVGNGYVVTEYIKAHEPYYAKHEYVFQTFSELMLFLDGHFSWRCKSIKKDEIDND